MSGGRIQRGWALTKQSFRVLRDDRSLLLFPIISIPVAVAATAIVMGPGVALYTADNQEAILIAFGVVTLYVLTFVTVFFNVALAAAASTGLSGGDSTVGEGLRAARGRLGVIAAWALVQTVVGVIISAIQSATNESVVGRILGGLVSFAWSAATFFVVSALGWPWRAVVLIRVLPAAWLDWLYDGVARHRHFFGRREHCFMPRPEHAGRFLDASPTAPPR